MSNYCELRDSRCFGKLRGSILRIDLVIRLKGGWNPFFVPQFGPKAPKLPKIRISQPLVVEMCLTPQNYWKTWFTTDVFRYTHPSSKWKCPKITISVFWGLIMTQLYDFPYLVNRRSNKVSWPLKMTIGMDLIWVFYNTYTPQATKSTQKIKRQEKALLRMPFFVFSSFSGHIWRNFKIFCFTRTICLIKLVAL